MTQTKTEYFTLDFNSHPLAIDLKLSKSTVFRTNSVYVYSNGTDIEDIEQNLTPDFEYRDPNDQVWNNTYLSSPQYQNTRWEVTFTPPKTAVVGLYDFRVRFNDTIPALSVWLCINDSLSVLNNIPDFENIMISNDSALLGDSIYIWLNSTDIEDPEENLSIELEYRDPNELSWDTLDLNEPEYLNEKWVVGFNITINAIFGYYDFRTRCNDSDGDCSGWNYLNDSLLVYNTAPKVIDIELSKSELYRTELAFLYVEGRDYETPEGMLTFSAQSKHTNENEWIDLAAKYANNSWEGVFITYPGSTLGIYDFRFKFEDNESASSGWIYHNNSLEVLNNLPVISNTLDNIDVGIKPLIFDLSPYEGDKEDSGEDLIWSLDIIQYHDYLESISIIDTINDTLRIVPLENVAGDGDIELTLTDKDGGTVTKTDITIYVDSLITELTPKVTLLSPIDTSIVNTLTPTLEWELDYNGTDIISYSVFLDENPDPTTKLITEIIPTSYTLKNDLEDGKTYYWKVLPKDGVYLSEPFSFTIDLSFEPFYKLNLTSEKDNIVIKQGEAVDIDITVKNEGNTIDSVEMEYTSANLQSEIDIDKSKFQLEPGISSIMTLSITIPEDFDIGKYSITVTAASLIAENINEEIMINIRIISKDCVPDYKVGTLISQESLDITQGESGNITITITNEGNIVDDYSISLISDQFDSSNVKISERSVSLEEGDSEQIIITIIVPEDMEPGKYHLKFLVNSEMVSNEIDVIVNVKSKEDAVKHDGEEDNSILWASISVIVIIIIVIIILFYLFIFKKKPTEVSEPDSEAELPVMKAPSLEDGLEIPESAQPESPESILQPEPEMVMHDAPPEVPSEDMAERLSLPPEVEFQTTPRIVPRLPPVKDEEPPVPRLKSPAGDQPPSIKSQQPPIPKLKQSSSAQIPSEDAHQPPVPKIKGRIPVQQLKIKIKQPNTDWQE
jgi:uncharacterized membrane protein